MIALIPLLLSLAQAAPPPSGAIRGRVVDRDTGRPLVRAVVRVFVVRGSGEDRMATTDERGLFSIEGLASGDYGGVVTARQHAAEPLTADGIELARDEVVDLVVRVGATYGLDVRVVDPAGEPLSGIELRARSIDTGGSFVVSSLRGTDDLGHVRLYGLPPGQYVLCADAHGYPSETAQSRVDRLLPTCYPSDDAEHANPVRIDRADLEGLEIRMRRGRTFTISGSVLDAAGAPAPQARVEFIQIFPDGSSGAGSGLGPDGRFRFANVVPGPYAIRASLYDASSPRQKVIEAGFVDLPNVDSDVDDLVVALRKTADVQGRVVAEDGSASLSAAMRSGFTIQANLPGVMGNVGSSIHAQTRDDLTFTLAGMFGARVLGPAFVPGGWYVKAVRYDGRDIIDTPVEFKSGSSVDIVLSNRGAMVNGTVAGSDDAPAARAMVYLLSLAGPRGIEIVDASHATDAGAFKLGPVRGGDYALVALPPTVELPPYLSQDRLARLAALGERVTLTDLDERSLPLRIVRER